MTTRLNKYEAIAARIYGLSAGEAKFFVELREAAPDMRDHHVNRLNKETRKVWACNLRKKIKHHGFDIVNIRGKGYQLVEVAG